jgi:hypothetical protein
MLTIRAVLNHHAFCSDIARVMIQRYLARVDIWMCSVALKGMRVPPKHIIAQMNATQLAYIEPYVESFPKQAFAGAVKRNDVHAAEFIRQRRKLHPYWVYKIASGEIPTMAMYEWLRNWGVIVLSPALYWCDRDHINVPPASCNDDIALIAARPDACTLDLHPHVMYNIRLLNCTFTREDVAKARHTMWEGLQADRAVELGIATPSNVYNLSTAAAIVLSEKYNIPIEKWIQILRWDDESYAWMDTKRHTLTWHHAYPQNERALRWLAMHPSTNVHGELPIRYGLDASMTYNGTISVKMKNWLCETSEGAARLREVVDMITAQNTWSNAHILAACRYVDPVTWRKMYKHKIKRRHLVGVLHHGNLDLLAYMHTSALELFSDTSYLLAHMRHARTWRWLKAHGYTSERIHLDLDPKPCLIVAFHRMQQKYTYASKSAWIKRLCETLPPI